jgi:hypothetical protein
MYCFSLLRHFFNAKSFSVVAVAEQLVLKLSGASRLKQVQPSRAIRLGIPATTKNFWLKMASRFETIHLEH